MGIAIGKTNPFLLHSLPNLPKVFGGTEMEERGIGFF